MVDFVERNIENASEEELMTTHTQMMTHINEETEKQQQNSAELDPVEEADREVAIKCAEELKKLCQVNAKVGIKPVNITLGNSEGCVVGQPSQVMVYTSFQNGQPTKKMHSVKATLTSNVDGSCVQTKVVWKHQNAYLIEFTPTVRGRHHLEVTVNEIPVLGGSVQLLVKLSPAQLGKPVRRIEVGKQPAFAAINSLEEVLVTSDDEVMVFDKSGKKLRSFTHTSMDPWGVAVDQHNNVYVSDYDNCRLYKFDKSGKFLKSIGQKGSGEGEFIRPLGMTVVDDEVIVCDTGNHRLQVFTSDLVFVRQIGSLGSGNGRFNTPFDVAHDKEGNLYITDFGNNRIQVFSTQGKFLSVLVVRGHITRPRGICVCKELVYISQTKEDGKLYVFDKDGHEVCSFLYGSDQWGIAVDNDGFIYVCNSKYRVLVF